MNIIDVFSLPYLQHTLLSKYGSKKNRIKINNYFSTFTHQHKEIDYQWVKQVVYIPAINEFMIRKELEKLLNLSIVAFSPIKVDKSYNYNHKEISKLIDERNKKQKDEREKINNDYVIEFLDKISLREFGIFDLEFWENDHSYILEFGWVCVHDDSVDCVHLLVSDYEHLNNGVFVKSKKYSRTDTEIVTLKEALTRFESFVESSDLILGHGLDNDLKILLEHDIQINKPIIDTSILGSILIEGVNVQDKHRRVKLETLLDECKLEKKDLHNATNDCEAILKIINVLQHRFNLKKGQN